MSFDINKLLTNAVSSGASDIHLSVGSSPIYRIHGDLTKIEDELLRPEDTEIMAQKLLGDLWEKFAELGELDFSYELKEVGRFRVNTFRQKGSISIAARVIPNTIPTIDELQLPCILNKLALKPYGLILVTGPTGSGKSTTLAAMIDHVNRNLKRHIITLEDPIEFIHEHKRSIIQQREVGSDTNNFANGLRATLRQDPDIILVGEMRDLETISTAITAAETGHLVIATLHTNNAAETINRIIDVFPPSQQGQIRIQLASVLEAIISQRLFKRIDIPGRIAATEILLGHPSISNLIRNEKVDQIDNIIQTSKALGMHTLEMSIKELLNEGKISAEQANPYFM